MMLPQVGQGALAVECRADDDAHRARAWRRSRTPSSRVRVDVERAFLAELGGDCDLPVGAHAYLDVDGQIRSCATFLSGPGRMLARPPPRPGPRTVDWAVELAREAAAAVALVRAVRGWR